ncbi:MAG: murein L,D-transpeptidase catalytic domain family protein [Rikenellaceae bacterium]|nr:murein L,D-transpeptidase catalytic domain family protein [Rikenellaceae bacterium]
MRICRAQRRGAEFDRLKVKAAEALAYCKAHNLNTDMCMLVDFGIHSGCNRFFVWDFKRSAIVCQSLCAHGYGRGSTGSAPVFSNEEGSYCSSLGHYRIGARAYSKYGINVHNKLHGLDATNSNAFKRIVVLHSFDPMPEVETYPVHLPLGMSQGCPVISNNTMHRVDTLLQQAKKPTLLWIYD